MIPYYLSKIKSAGVYRYVFDKSQVPASEASSLRLLIGYSEKGTFNTPVYIEDYDAFQKEFGASSRRMERKGIFFHRMAQQMLSDGDPILALNLKPFSGEEVVNTLTFAASDIRLDTSNNQVGEPGLKGTAYVAHTNNFASSKGPDTVYDTNRFWKVIDNTMDMAVTNAPRVHEAAPNYLPVMRIAQTSSEEDSVTVFIRPYRPESYDMKISEWYSSVMDESMPPYLECVKDLSLADFFIEIYVFKGNLCDEKLYQKTGTLGNIDSSGTWSPYCTIKDGMVYTNRDFVNAWGEEADALDELAAASTSNYLGKYSGCLLPSFIDSGGSTISIDASFNSDYSVHKCVMNLDESILDKLYDEYEDENSLRIAILNAVSPSYRVNELDEYEEYDIAEVPAMGIPGYYLKGYEYVTIEKSRSGKELIEVAPEGKACIYDVLGYKGIYQALTNNVDVDYKYLVDSFQAYPGPAMKARIAAIAKKKFNCLAILNFPPIQECAIYTGYPGMGGGFSMKNVTGSGSGISLPTDSQGASWCAFYTQLKFVTNSTTYIIPSAGLVSNLFMTKRALRTPYNIVAGPNWGRIEYTDLAGPDYNYAQEDMDYLEPFGVNVIQYVPKKGICVNGNQTAKQKPKSGLSKIHIRELVTFVQDEVEEMLRGYQWELNTSTLRANVETKCKQILDLVQANGGIYDYRVQCDDKNNTPETIDNELMVVDLAIEPARGSEKCVQTLTLHRTGAIASLYGS